MLGRMTALAVLIALAGCAGMETAGRNARTGDAVAPPPPATSAPPPAASAAPPPATSASPPPASTAAPPVEQRAGTTTPAGDENVVVPGARERQVPAPGGDPRSNAERMQDIRAWDRCVMRVQSAAEADPMRPQLETPEDYCRESLGMADRMAVPQSRLERR